MESTDQQRDEAAVSNAPVASSPETEEPSADGSLSYEQLVEMYDESMRNLSEGEIVPGIIIGMTSNEAIVDIGYKSEGLVPLREFTTRDGELTVDVGDEVEVLLEQTEGAEGHVMLSKIKAEGGSVALQAYLRQAVLNGIRNELRRKGRQPHATDLDGVELEDADSPLEHAIGRQAVERYEEALQRLTAEEREAIIGRVEMGYSYEELAEALGRPSPEAARKAARRALTRLAREMERAAESPGG